MNWYIATVFSVFFLFSATYSNAQTENYSDETISVTDGTFQFESPTNTPFYWPDSFIESLYNEIESRREDYFPVEWEYSSNMTIIIYSREYINSAEFSPNDSPYKGIKEPK